MSHAASVLLFLTTAAAGDPSPPAPAAAAPEAPAASAAAEPPFRFVLLDGDQLLFFSPDTGAREPVAFPGRTVRSAAQDASGAWWVWSEPACDDCPEGEAGAGSLHRTTPALDPNQLQPMTAGIPASHGHVFVDFGNGATVQLTDFQARRKAAVSCGAWGDRFLCDESMGWAERSSFRWAPGTAHFEALGVVLPEPSRGPATSSKPLPPAFANTPCSCWDEPMNCGSAKAFGTDGLSLLFVSVDCGDMVHPACVVASADGRAFTALPPASEDGVARWVSHDQPPSEDTGSGTCGPYAFSHDSRWFIDERGSLCSLADGIRCTPLAGDLVGAIGRPPTVVGFP